MYSGFHFIGPHSFGGILAQLSGGPNQAKYGYYVIVSLFWQSEPITRLTHLTGGPITHVSRIHCIYNLPSVRFIPVFVLIQSN